MTLDLARAAALHLQKDGGTIVDRGSLYMIRDGPHVTTAYAGFASTFQKVRLRGVARRSASLPMPRDEIGV